MNIMKTVAALAALSLAGCFSSTEPTVREDDSVSGRMRQYEGQFVPSAEDQPAAAPNGTPTNGELKAIPGAVDQAPAPSAAAEVAGFRIQLFSTNNFDEAGAKKAEAEALFKGEWVYLQYDQPTYKIRVGNFVTRFDAERFRTLAIEKGFSGAWIVPEKVFKNPPSPP